MKEAYAVRRTVPPSAEIEAQIDQLLAVGVGENPREALSELAKLGVRLIIQRAVEDEFDAWLGRARYERRPEAPPGLRNGFRPRRVQTGEGELSVEIPQAREAAEPFVSRLFPRATKLLRTEPLKAMVVGAFVRGLSMRDVESLCEQAGLGKLSKSTAARICSELRERFEAFQRRDLYDIQLAALFLDAVFLSVRPEGPKEGVLVAWGFTEEGERVLLAVMLGMRESHEDWLARPLVDHGALRASGGRAGRTLRSQERPDPLVLGNRDEAAMKEDREHDRRHVPIRVRDCATTLGPAVQAMHDCELLNGCVGTAALAEVHPGDDRDGDDRRGNPVCDHAEWRPSTGVGNELAAGLP
jgi:Transposase, Mutator family